MLGRLKVAFGFQLFLLRFDVKHNYQLLIINFAEGSDLSREYIQLQPRPFWAGVV